MLLGLGLVALLWLLDVDGYDPPVTLSGAAVLLAGAALATSPPDGTCWRSA